MFNSCVPLFSFHVYIYCTCSMAICYWGLQEIVSYEYLTPIQDIMITVLIIIIISYSVLSSHTKVTSLLQPCCNPVARLSTTTLLQDCHKVAKTMELKLLQPCCKVVARLLQNCGKVAVRLWRHCKKKEKIKELHTFVGTRTCILLHPTLL